MLDFIDHILREMPSRRLINLKRSYFSRVANSTERTLIGGGIEAMKGVYQTIRAAEVLYLIRPSISLLTSLAGKALGYQRRCIQLMLLA